MADHILVIDEGTTSTRAIVFDRAFRQVALAQEDIDLAFPKSGWVTQDANAIWQATERVCQSAINAVGGAGAIAALGITNQRETTLLWDRETLEPSASAIVWQDRRTAMRCDALRVSGEEPRGVSTTGLLIDPYFSATKLQWLLAHHGGPVDRLAFGTIDTWLVAKLTGGRVHATDVTNASRTLLMDLETGAWSADMADLFAVPQDLLPEIKPSAAHFGETDPVIFGRSIPILSAIGDQQGALVGQGCLNPGDAKITYGTGAFLVANTGEVRPHSRHKLLATKGYGLSSGEAAFALEGSIFNAGTVVKWLRDDLGLVPAAANRLADLLVEESPGHAVLKGAA